MTVVKPVACSIKRIVTCQGSIQLVTALSVLFYRQREQHHQTVDYQNYLVIYDLYAPNGQSAEFAAFIERMAESVCDWVSIVYLTPATLESISQKLNSTAPAKLFNTIHSLIGTETADEIYLCRNWQYGNQLLLNAYQAAQKVCYGDSIGIYFSATSSVVSSAQSVQTEAVRSKTNPLTNLLRLCRLRGGIWRDQLQDKLQLRTVIKPVAFDTGYFVLPDVFGEVPPMPTVTLDHATILEIFQKLTILAASYTARFQAKFLGAPISILLTSNLSEAGRLSQNQEIQAYRQFLMSQAISPDTVLVIKPHPRDDIAKIDALKEALADLFGQVLILSEPALFFLPFEVFFLAAFPDVSFTSKRDIKVFAVSSACLSLKLLFNVSSFIGFGHDLTSKLFNQSHIAARLEHEQILETALQKLETSRSTIRKM